MNSAKLFLLGLLIAALVFESTGCQSGNAQEQPQTTSTPTNSGIWFSGSNLGTLNTTPTPIIQPAPQITQAGSYMFFGNVSIANVTGVQPTATCFIQVGSTNLLQSVAGALGTLGPANLSATGAATLASSAVPATVSLICSANNDSNLTVTQASISILSVGTLQTNGP
jgi:hypothetical protein